MSDINNNVRTYRFKLDPNIVTMIHDFAIMHKHDSREDYKEFWEQWLQENSECLKTEETRLERMGYSGDFRDKIYKSGRYYYKKKGTSLDKKEPKRRRKYVNLEPDFLDCIDDFIKDYYTKNVTRPQECYVDFLENKKEEYGESMKHLTEEQELSKNDAENKIKKTFKNRYFQYMKDDCA